MPTFSIFAFDNYKFMQFRVRPSSKRSNQAELSLLQFPTAKSLAGGDSPLLPRSVASRIDQLQASLSHMQELHRRERQISNTGYIQVQKRLDKVQYKLFSTEQDLRQLNEIRQIKQPRQSFVQYNNEPSKNQIMLLKQVILQDKQAQKDSIKHLHTQLEQMSLKLMRQEQETRQLLGSQRMEMQHRLSGQGEELKEIQGLKQRKIQQQYEMMKGIIANAQRKIFQELQRKIRNQTVVRDFVQDKIAQLKEELSMEHRQTLASQTKFIKQTKLSLQTLFALVNSFKKELSQELAQTQKLTTNSFKKLSMTLDITKERSNDEIKNAIEMHQQVSNEIVQLRNFITSRLQENRQSINQFEQHTMERMDQGSNSRASSSIDTGKFTQFQKDMNQWKSITEQKNLNVFKQISNTLKALKVEWRKENDDLVSEVAALNQSLKSLKKSGPADLKKSVQALVSIFNKEFDVLAQELQTMTDMISLAKKENQKLFKQSLNKLRAEINEEIKNAINQKSKENNQYTDKTVGRSEQNMRSYIQKQVKFASDSLSQRIDKSQTLLQQLQSTMKKANLLTAAQLEEYSLKLKSFNDNYKDYLQQQRKDDMKKRMELQQTMRKNANNLMDICYKKSQFLVEGLKKNIEVSQMKEKVQAAQALDSAKDELKKQIQGTRLQWQKQLSQGIQKITKQRENSQQILHEAIEQSINNAKRNLSNQIGNNKLQIQEKINQMKVNEVKKEAQRDQQHHQLKNTILQMMRDEKKLNQQHLNKTKQQIETKVQTVQKTQNDKDLEYKAKIQIQKKQIEALLSAQIKKIQNSQREENDKTKTGLDKQILSINTKTKELTQEIQELKKLKNNMQQEIMKGDQDSKSKEAELDKKITTLTQTVETNHKILNQKITEVNKKLGESQSNIEKEKAASLNEGKNKQAQLLTNINKLAQDVETKNKTTNTKLEQLNKKLTDLQISSQKKQGEGKKVGEQTLNQIKSDLQKSITKLQARMEELQLRDKGDQTEQSINAIRKSVNKLQAMTFSQQAKNKALFDRLTEDVNKIGQNLALITNQIRQ